MDSAALLIAIEDLLARPLPESGREDHVRGYELVHVTAGEHGPCPLDDVVAALRPRLGPPTTVAVDGVTDPSLLRHLPGPPLSDVLVARAVEMHGWTIGHSWLGVGLLENTTDDPGVTATVNLVAVRALLNPVHPAGSSWVAELAALTGWSGERRVIDWESVERKLGLRLPRDYKQLAETFGAGTFDDNLWLCVPGSPHLDDLDLFIADHHEFAEPAPASRPTIRLLQWAATSAEHSFCWLVEDPDPERWPVFARDDACEPWERFDCSAAEFVHRMLTDPHHAYTLAKHFESHWFTSDEEVERAQEAFWDEYHPHW
ncbi:SMI1/KNR4 family protein [Embleya sp. NPDC127516]|uniref:SMI1/KNR4 family protein n=1 Tax=Embleya sp. NPDC127516 TaxID=3363990 RepID=UPI0037F25259